MYLAVLQESRARFAVQYSNCCTETARTVAAIWVCNTGKDTRIAQAAESYRGDRATGATIKTCLNLIPEHLVLGYFIAVWSDQPVRCACMGVFGQYIQ